MNLDMKRNFILQGLLILLLGVSFFACESEYSRVVKKELRSDVVHEDLIFGMKLGQTQEDFYSINHGQLLCSV